MNSLILFVNQFLSYFVVMLVIVIVAAAGFIVGRVWAKKGKANNNDNSGSNVETNVVEE